MRSETTHPCGPEAVKKLNDLSSPRPNEGEGLGVRGAMHAASSLQERLRSAPDAERQTHAVAVRQSPSPPSPSPSLGRGEPQSNLISIFSHLPPSKGESHRVGPQGVPPRLYADAPKRCPFCAVLWLALIHLALCQDLAVGLASVVVSLFGFASLLGRDFDHFLTPALVYGFQAPFGALP